MGGRGHRSQGRNTVARTIALVVAVASGAVLLALTAFVAAQDIEARARRRRRQRAVCVDVRQLLKGER
jgi:hypothetical protein